MSKIYEAEFIKLQTDGAIGDPFGMPAYAYIRVSTKDQGEEGRTGLPRQIGNIHEVARKKGYRIELNMVFADDYSGFEFEDRPGLTSLRSEIASGQRRANTVIIEHIDRLSRNAEWHQGYLLHEFKSKGVETVFWKQFTSRIELAVMGALAQDSMEQAKERMREGKLRKAQMGLIPTGKPPYGYKIVDKNGNVPRNGKEAAYYAVVEEEAAIVRYIYDQLVNGMSVRRLADHLTEKGVPPPGNFLRWQNGALLPILKNTVYKGEYYYNKTYRKKVQIPTSNGLSTRIINRIHVRPEEQWVLIPVPAIITEFQWEFVRDLRIKNKQNANRNAKSPFLLTGIIRCAICGYAVRGRTAKQSNDYQTYVCAERQRNRCANKYISVKTVDRGVWRVVHDILTDPSLIARAINETATSKQNKSLEQQLNYLNEALEKNNKNEERLYKAYMAGVFDEIEYREKRQLLKSERAIKAREADAIRKKMISVDQAQNRISSVMRLIQKIKDDGMLIDPPFEIKKQILKIVLDKVIYDGRDETIMLHGAVNGMFSIVDSSPHQTIHNTSFQIHYSLTQKQILSITA